MQEITKFTPGTFCWIELFTSKVAAAKDYYTKLFNWNYEEVPLPDNQVYTMPQVDGKPMGGMFPIVGEMKEQGIPPNWNAYVGVQNVDEATNKAQSLGATTIKPPFDVMETGRMSVIQDPTGAYLSLWQAKDQNSPGIARNINGSLSWNELITNDTKMAVDFYGNLFGWTSSITKFEQPEVMEYTEFKLGDISVGGMMAINEGMASELCHPHWMTYLAVNDCDENAAKSKELGGRILYAPKMFPNVGKMAVIQDPQGAIYSTIKYQPGK